MPVARKNPHAMHGVWESLVGLLYPRLCVGCGSDLVSADQLVCLDCTESLPLTNFHLCPGNPVEKLFHGRIHICQASAYVYFSKGSSVQQILHHLKYRGNRKAGIFFGRRMGHALRQSAAYDGIEGLIPVPLHRRKEKVRGYNQAELLCRGMSEVMQVPVMSGAVIKTTSTESQTRKNRERRWQNTEGSFKMIRGADVAGKHVLLVDDVLTTGATLEACGAEILTVPGVRLGIVTLAYTSL